ncbi:hypothetical protein PHAMO_180105 [Magnetospirillum molischianum DSM 120]|uniref:HTH cro/C1-type domain-containing protein n=1 Tax=Magnetospirillum molischianum DSM 120 TaxID=1150626 RepID=H8FP48_MAGML|nr:hypothetical protein PHAMO_180105 [Magnetospirillum molischianum DSM 120]
MMPLECTEFCGIVILMIIEASIARCRAFAHSPGMSKARLASLAGLHRNALRDMDRTDWSPTADTLRKLEAVIPPDWYPPEESPTPTTSSEAA